MKKLLKLILIIFVFIFFIMRITFHDILQYSKTKIVDGCLHINKYIKKNLSSLKDEPLKIDTIKIHEYYINLFSKCRVDTEYTAYKKLKESPIKGVNYLAIPWVHLINSRQLDMVPNIQLNGGFTICQHIRYREILPFIQRIGLKVLFTPHAHMNEFYEDIKVLPFPHFAVNGALPVLKKDLLYSFIGYTTHHTRETIFDMSHVSKTIIKRRAQWHFYLKKSCAEQEKKEYQEALARSRFSLCPRGAGPSTIRFWESLQAGAIPILISDDTCLPKGVDWDTCIVRIAETDVHLIKEIINSIPPEKEQKMRENCLKAYDLFSGKNFVNSVRDYYSL